MGILICVFNRKLNSWRETMRKYDVASSISKVEKLFKKYKFNIDCVPASQREILLNGDVSKYESILNELSSEAYSFLRDSSFPIGDILISSSPVNVRFIMKAYNDKRISDSFILEHPQIFITDVDQSLIDSLTIKKGVFKDFQCNVSLLFSNKVNTLDLSNKKPSILLTDRHELYTFMNSVLIPYGLDLSNLSTYDIFLCDSKRYIDEFTELGLYNYIHVNPDFVNSNSGIIINRIKLCKMLGIAILIDGKINPIITNNPFVISNNTLSDDTVKAIIDGQIKKLTD